MKKGNHMNVSKYGLKIISTLSVAAFSTLLLLSPVSAESKSPEGAKSDEIVIDGMKPSKLQIFTPGTLPSMKPAVTPQRVAPQQVTPPAAPATPAAQPAPTTPAAPNGAPAAAPAATPATPAAPTASPDAPGTPSIEGIPLNDPVKLKKWLEDHGITAAGSQSDEEHVPTAAELENYYLQVWKLVGAKYYDTTKLKGWEKWATRYKGKLVTAKDLENALTEMLGAVGDRWTTYTSHDQIERYRALAKNDIVNLGAMVAQNADGTFRIEFLSYGSAAWNSNAFRTGDILKSVHVSPEDKTTSAVELAGKSKKEVEELLEQKVGTKVTVVIEHDGKSESVDLQFMKTDRAPILLRLLPNNMGYIRLPSFGSDAQSVEALGNAFVEGLAALDEKNHGKLDALVLDLRGNSGGAVELAKMIASLFIEDGTFIRTKERDASNPRVYVTSTQEFTPTMPFLYYGMPPEVVQLLQRLKTMPMAVLVNGSSASSSEILTSTLQDNKRAVVIGTQTFGKAVAFINMPTPTGGGLQVTVMRYLTPSGTDIAGKGITPDLVMDNPRGKQATDLQLAAAVTVLTEQVNKLGLADGTTAIQQGDGEGGESVLLVGIGLGLMLLVAVLGNRFHHYRKQRDEAERKQKKDNK